MTIVGHEKNISLLKRLLEREHPIHAFLFWGPEKVGKKTIAVGFAKGLLCRARTFDGCGECAVCAEWEQMGGAMRDFVLVSPENGVISIERTRDIVTFLANTPGLASRKVVVIDDADRLTEEAQNMILKSAEEPPHDSSIIFVTSRPGKLFETLRSRLVSIAFQLLDDKKIECIPAVKRLAEREREVVISLSSGRPGRAAELACKPSLLNAKKELLEIAERVTSAGIPDKMLFAKDMSEKLNLKDIFSFWLAKLHQDMHKAADARALADSARNARLLLTASFLAEDTNVNKRLLLEQLLLSWQRQ